MKNSRLKTAHVPISEMHRQRLSQINDMIIQDFSPRSLQKGSSVVTSPYSAAKHETRSGLNQTYNSNLDNPLSAPQILNNSRYSKIVDLLNPQIDFLDGLDQSLKLKFDKQRMRMLNSQPEKEQQDQTSEVSTTFSDVSNTNILKRLKHAHLGKNGKQIIPKYLKEDFPNPDLLPCKELIARLPSHVDRPPAEKFDAIILNLYKSMSKQKTTSNHNKKRKLRLRTQQNIKEISKETQLQDQHYTELFGTQDLQIQRLQRTKKPSAVLKKDLVSPQMSASRDQRSQSRTNQSEKTKDIVVDQRKFMINLERTELSLKPVYDPDKQLAQKAPNLYTKFSKASQQQLLPIPLGFFNTSKKNDDAKARTLGSAQFKQSMLINSNQSRAKTSNQRNRKQSVKTSPRVLNQSLEVRKSVNQSSDNQKQGKFFDKKKIPGLLDFLESKIYERKDLPVCKELPRLEEEKQLVEWKNAQKYYNLEFEQGTISKTQPLIDQRKRKLLSNLLRNDHLVIKSVHNQMIERIIYGKASAESSIERKN